MKRSVLGPPALLGSYLLLAHLFVLPIFADTCPAAEPVTTEWLDCHNAWWDCLNNQIRPLQAANRGCTERDNVLAGLLRRAPYPLNLGIAGYNPPNHPVEDHRGDLLFCLDSLNACEQTAYQYGIELGACEQYFDFLSKLAKKKLRLRH